MAQPLVVFNKNGTYSVDGIAVEVNEDDSVEEQLRFSNLINTIKVLRANYGIRLPEAKAMVDAARAEVVGTNFTEVRVEELMNEAKDQLAPVVKDITQSREFSEGVRVTLWYVLDFLRECEKTNDYALSARAIRLGKFCADGDTSSPEYLAALTRFNESQADDNRIKSLAHHFSSGYDLQAVVREYIQQNRERFGLLVKDTGVKA